MSDLISAFAQASDGLRGALPYRWKRIRSMPVSSDEALISLVEQQMGLHIVRLSKQHALEEGGYYIVRDPEGAYYATRYDADGHLLFVDETLCNQAVAARKKKEEISTATKESNLPTAEPVGDLFKDFDAHNHFDDNIKTDEDYILQPEDCELYYQVMKATLIDRFDLTHIISADSKSKGLFKNLIWVSLFINLMVVVVPMYMNALYTRIIPAHADASLWSFSFAVALAVIAEYSLRRSREGILLKIAERFHTTLEPLIIRRLLSLGVNKGNEWGIKQYRSLSDWRQLRSFMWNAASANVIDVPFIAVYLFFIILMGQWIIIVPLLIFVVAFFIMRHVWRMAEKESKTMKLPRDNLLPVDVQTGALVGRLDLVSDRFMADSETEMDNWKVRFNRQSFVQRSMLALIGAQTVLIVVVAYYLVLIGALNVGAIFAVILLSGRISGPLMAAANLVYDAYGARQAHKKLNELLASSADEPVQDIHLETSAKLQNPLWNIEKATFSYAPDKIILDDISFAIPKGQKVAIVGAPKTGKSTLLQILAGHFPLEKGTVSFSTRPLHAGDESIKRLIHYGWQGPIMLASSVYEYLNLEGDVGRADCDRVLHQLDLVSDEMPLARLMEKTWRDAGFIPNPAQKQMLSIARLALSKRPIIMLDDPSSQLSHKQEAILVNLLRNKMQRDTTLVMVTDRIELLKLVDRVIHINHGHISFDGATRDFFQRNMPQGGQNRPTPPPPSAPVSEQVLSNAGANDGSSAVTPKKTTSVKGRAKKG